MKNVLFCLIIGFVIFTINGQNSNHERRAYKVWIDLNHQNDIKGYLKVLKDSSVIIVEDAEFKEIEIEVLDVKRLKFRSKGKVGRGVAIGGAAGLLLGALGGYSDGDDEPGFLSLSAEEKAYGLGFTMLTVGASVGAVAGAIKTKYVLNGDLENYNKYRIKMNKYVFIRND